MFQLFWWKGEEKDTHSHNKEIFLYPLILILMIMIKLEHKLVNEKELINKCSLRLN